MSIYLQNEFDSTWPLWQADGRRGRIALGAAEISGELCEWLRRWNAYFHERYSWEEGWGSANDERTHRLEGQRLLLYLREELGDNRVELRLWECRPFDPSVL